MAMSPACCYWTGKIPSGPGDLDDLKLIIAQVMLRLMRKEGLIGTSVGCFAAQKMLSKEYVQRFFA